MNNALVTLIANIALTLSVIVAVIFGIAQVRTANKDRRERLTLETLRSFQTREFAELLYHIHRMEVPSSYADWGNWAPEDRVHFIQLSQQMETLGLLLSERLISIDLVDKTLGSFVNRTWERYKPLVLEIRETTDDPYMSEYFQWMAEQIERRMNEKPRKPFFQSSKTAV